MELSASVMSLSSVLGIKLDFGKFSEATGVVVTLGVCACGALCGANQTCHGLSVQRARGDLAMRLHATSRARLLTTSLGSLDGSSLLMAPHHTDTAATDLETIPRQRSECMISAWSINADCQNAHTTTCIVCVEGVTWKCVTSKPDFKT